MCLPDSAMYNKLLSTLVTEVNIELDHEKKVENYSLIQRFNFASVFNGKFLQHASFWIETVNKTACKKKFSLEKSQFDHFYSIKQQMLIFLSFFKTHGSKEKLYWRNQNLNFEKALDFDSIFSQGVMC